MEVRLSTAARNRAFGKAIRRLRPSVEPVLKDIQVAELAHPTWSTVLLTLTDELPTGVLREIGADEGTLQLCAGFPEFADWSPNNDRSILEAIMEAIRLAIDQCGLTPSDRDLLAAILK